LEQWFISIDNLLDEEDIDPFMDDEIELVMTVLINETSKSHITKLTIERFFQQVFTRFLHQNLLFCTNPA
jgi:hypothetical protein